jgi:hypothetical protein
MVSGQVGVVKTTSTIMSHTWNHICRPPPPLTVEVFFAQFLGSQRNAEQLQKNMEDFMCTIANNV